MNENFHVFSSVAKSVEELEEKTRIQEEKYEEEVKGMKKEIRMMKKKILDCDEIFKERVKEVQDGYLRRVMDEKEEKERCEGKLREKLEGLKEELRSRKEESVRVFATSSKIKSSLADEVFHLETQRSSFSHITLEIKSQTNNLEQVKTKELQRNLKALKEAQSAENEEVTLRLAEEKQQILNISTHKTDLLNKLQQTLSVLKDEQSQVKTSKFSRLSELKTQIQSTKSEIKDLKFRAGQVKSESLSKKITELEVQNKAELVESLKSANKDLWQRYEKLSKLIF